jgi:hypothetical protein
MRRWTWPRQLDLFDQSLRPPHPPGDWSGRDPGRPRRQSHPRCPRVPRLSSSNRRQWTRRPTVSGTARRVVVSPVRFLTIAGSRRARAGRARDRAA